MKIRILLLLLFFLIFSGCVGVSSKGLFGTGVSVAFDPRSVGTQIDDSIMQKNLSARMVMLDKKYIICDSLNYKIKFYDKKFRFEKSYGGKDKTRNISHPNYRILAKRAVRDPHLIVCCYG